MRKNLPIIVLVVAIAIACGLGIYLNQQRVNDIERVGRDASRLVCETARDVRASSRRTDAEQLTRNRNARIPTAAELGLSLDPAAEAYVQSLGQGLIDSQIAYFEDRLRRFPPLKCAAVDDGYYRTVVAETDG